MDMAPGITMPQHGDGSVPSPVDTTRDRVGKAAYCHFTTYWQKTVVFGHPDHAKTAPHSDRVSGAISPRVFSHSSHVSRVLKKHVLSYHQIRLPRAPVDRSSRGAFSRVFFTTSRITQALAFSIAFPALQA